MRNENLNTEIQYREIHETITSLIVPSLLMILVTLFLLPGDEMDHLTVIAAANASAKQAALKIFNRCRSPGNINEVLAITRALNHLLARLNTTFGNSTASKTA